MTLTIGSQNFEQPLTSHVPSYVGDELFTTASVQGDVLTVTISQDPSVAKAPGMAAKIAQVIFTYKPLRADGTTGPAITNAWTITAPSGDIGYTGLALLPKMSISPDLSEGRIFVAEVPAVLQDPPNTTSRLGFVLIQGETSGANPNPWSQLAWIDNSILVSNSARFTDASVVKPAVLMGGVSGPIGLSMP